MCTYLLVDTGDRVLERFYCRISRFLIVPTLLFGLSIYIFDMAELGLW